MIAAAANPKAWRGLRYPDSDLVGLLMRHARPGRDLPAASGFAACATLGDPMHGRAAENETGSVLRPTALDAGCGAGRHVRLLEELGFQATGIDCDPEMIEAAGRNGQNVQLADARDYRPGASLDLAVCWGFMMVVPDGPAIAASWSPKIIIADWRPRSNSCYQWTGNQQIGGGAVRLHQPGHLLHGLTYYFHDLPECVIPGYDRIHWQHVTRRTASETNEWIQAVYRRKTP